MTTIYQYPGGFHVAEHMGMAYCEKTEDVEGIPTRTETKGISTTRPALANMQWIFD